MLTKFERLVRMGQSSSCNMESTSQGTLPTDPVFDTVWLWIDGHQLSSIEAGHAVTVCRDGPAVLGGYSSCLESIVRRNSATARTENCLYCVH